MVISWSDPRTRRLDYGVYSLANAEFEALNSKFGVFQGKTNIFGVFQGKFGVFQTLQGLVTKYQALNITFLCGVSKHALPKSRIKDVKVVVGGDQYLEYVRY